MSNVYVGDYGFIISFTSKFDLTSMTAVRMLIKKPRGKASFTFPLGSFTNVEVGDKLNYTIRSTDLSAAGKYEFQVAAKVEGSMDIAFDPFILHVKARSADVAWP